MEYTALEISDSTNFLVWLPMFVSIMLLGAKLGNNGDFIREEETFNLIEDGM